MKKPTEAAARAAKYYVQGMMLAIPRVIGAERPSCLVTSRQMAELLRVAFRAGARFERS